MNLIDDYKKRINEKIKQQNGYLNDLINKIKEETAKFNIDNSNPHHLIIELKELIRKTETVLYYLEKSMTELNVIENTLIYIEVDRNE